MVLLLDNSVQAKPNNNVFKSINPNQAQYDTNQPSKQTQNNPVQNNSGSNYQQPNSPSPNPLGDTYQPMPNNLQNNQMPSYTQNNNYVNSPNNLQSPNNDIDDKLNQLINNPDSLNQDTSINAEDKELLPKIKALELYLFKANYDEHTLDDRLNHLEREVFGSIKTGSPQNRLKALENKVKLPKTANIEAAVEAIPYTSKDGDFFSNITRFENNNVIRFEQFPVTLCLPEGIIADYRKEFDYGIKAWGKYIPLKIVSENENPDIKVIFVNSLPKHRIGITRIIAQPNNIKAEIYLLKPTNYAGNMPQKVLKTAFAHDLGHALGIFGHSDFKGDLMSSDPFMVQTKNKYHRGMGYIPGLSMLSSYNYAKNMKAPKITFSEPGVSKMDINTLKKIYETKSVSSQFSLAQPKEWD